MTAAVFQHYLRTTLLPAIVRKLGHLQGIGKVVVQMDNAPAHTAKATRELLARLGNETVPAVEFVFQPQQSPDTNVCDLGLFNHMQTKVYERLHEDMYQRGADARRNNADTIADAVHHVWRAVESSTINGLSI